MKINDIKKYLTKSLDKAKMFANIALHSNTESGTSRSKLTGIFYTFLLLNFGFVTPCIVVMAILPHVGEGQREVRDQLNTTVSTPVWSVNAPTALRVECNGKAEPFLFSAKQTNSTVMHSTEKNLQATSIQKEYARTPTKRVHTKKQSSKNFEDSENVSMFAESNATGQDIHGTTTDFLYPEEPLSKNKAVQISSSPLRSVCDGSCGKDERRTAFLDNTNSNFVTTMPQEDKNLKGLDHNTITSRTPTKRVHTKKKLLEYLSIEENAKNKAYYYIISSGNLEQFTNFCKQLPDGIDYGAACTAALILQFFNPQKTTL